MKKKVFIISSLVVVAFLVVACTGVLPIGPWPGKKIKLIDVELNVKTGDATKTAIVDNGRSGLITKWQAGDVLYAYAEDLGFVGKVICEGGEMTNASGVSIAPFKGRLAIPENYRRRDDSGSDSGYENSIALLFIYPGSEDFIGSDSHVLSFDDPCSGEGHKHHIEGTYSVLDLKPVEEVTELSKYDIAGAFCELSPNANGIYSGFVRMKNALSFMKISTLDMTEDITLNGLNNAVMFACASEQRQYLDGTPYDDYDPDYEVTFSGFQPSQPIVIPAGKPVLYIAVSPNTEMSGAGIFEEDDEYSYSYVEYDEYKEYVYVRGVNESGEVWGVKRFKTENSGKIYMNADGSAIALKHLTEGDLDMVVGYRDFYRNEEHVDVYAK